MNHRSLVALPLLVLVACSVSAPQLAERSTAPSLSALTLPESLLPQEPQGPPEPGAEPVAQEREPAAPQRGRRRYEETRPSYRSEISGSFSTGEFKLRTDGANLDDHTDAFAFRFDYQPAAERLVGFGISLETFITDDDLYRGRTIDNGVTNAPADARAIGVDIYPHAVFHPTRGRVFDVPIRVGIHLNYLGIDHRDADVRRSWFSIGPRVAAEPKFSVYRNADVDVMVFGGGALGFGATVVTVDYPIGDDSDGTKHTIGQLYGGVRVAVHKFIGEIAYRYSHMDFDDQALDLFGPVNSVDAYSQGIYFTFGGRF